MAEQAARHVWAIRQQQQRQQQHQQQQQPSTAQPQPSPPPSQPAPTPPPPAQPTPPTPLPRPTGAQPPVSNVLAALMNAVVQTPGDGDAAAGGTAELTSAIDWMFQLGNNVNAGDLISDLLGGQGDLFAAPSQVGTFPSHPLCFMKELLKKVTEGGQLFIC